MGAIAHFFGEYITGIDLARDVADVATCGLLKFANVIFLKVQMRDAFGSDQR